MNLNVRFDLKYRTMSLLNVLSKKFSKMLTSHHLVMDSMIISANFTIKWKVKIEFI